MESHLLIGCHCDGYVRAGSKLEWFDVQDEMCVGQSVQRRANERGDDSESGVEYVTSG